MFWSCFSLLLTQRLAPLPCPHYTSFLFPWLPLKWKSKQTEDWPIKQTKMPKAQQKQKIHENTTEFVFVLATYSWVWGLPWSMEYHVCLSVCLSNIYLYLLDIHLKKTDFPIVSLYWSQIASWLVAEANACFSIVVLGPPCQAWTCAGLVLATIFVGSCVHRSCWRHSWSVFTSGS